MKHFLLPLITLAQQNLYDEFLLEIEKYRKKDQNAWQIRHPQTLWVELVSLMVGSQFSAASFDLPQRPDALIPAQDGVMVDDGEAGATVTLGGGQGLSGPRMSAVLTVAGPKPYTFRAERISVTDGGREVALVFPSLAAFGLTPKPDGSDLSLEITMGADGWSGGNLAKWQVARVLYRRDKEKPDPGFTLAVPAGAVVADKDGKGNLQVQITFKQPPAVRAVVSVKGADITAVSAEPADALGKDGIRLTVGKDAVLTFTLQNLDSETPVVVSAKNDKGVAHDPMARPARRAQVK